MTIQFMKAVKNATPAGGISEHTVFDEVGLGVGFIIEAPQRGKMVLLKGGRSGEIRKIKGG